MCRLDGFALEIGRYLDMYPVEGEDSMLWHCTQFRRLVINQNESTFLNLNALAHEYPKRNIEQLCGPARPLVPSIKDARSILPVISITLAERHMRIFLHEALDQRQGDKSLCGYTPS